jgi:tetratricopeptide (TPR) repeat protein
MAYGKMGRVAESELDDTARIFKMAAGLDPKEAEIKFTLFILGIQNPTVQAEACKAVIRIMPDFATAHRFLGIACIKMGRHAEAVEALKTAIRLQPDDSAAHYQLGLAYLAMGNRAEALRTYQALQRLHPATAEKLRVLIDAR